MQEYDRECGRIIETYRRGAWDLKVKIGLGRGLAVFTKVRCARYAGISYVLGVGLVPGLDYRWDG
jgi:hypothetical protein